MDDSDSIDPRFRRFIMGNAPVEKLVAGMRWIDDIGLGIYRQPPNYAVYLNTRGAQIL